MLYIKKKKKNQTSESEREVSCFDIFMDAASWSTVYLFYVIPSLVFLDLKYVKIKKFEKNKKRHGVWRA